MLTEFPESGKFPRSGMHSPSDETRVWKQVIAIIKGNANANTQSLMNSCTLKNHTCASILFYFCLILFNQCYLLLFTHSYLSVVVAYHCAENVPMRNFFWSVFSPVFSPNTGKYRQEKTPYLNTLNVNTFRTHIFIYSNFYLIFLYYVFTYLTPSFPPKLPMRVVVFW